MDPERRKTILWLGGLGAALLVFGYLTSEQWLRLVAMLLGN